MSQLPPAQLLKPSSRTFPLSSSTIMAASSITGIFPIQSVPTADSQRTSCVVSLAGENLNNRDATLDISNKSPMRDNAQLNHVCFVSGALIIDNDSTESTEQEDWPRMNIEASTVEDLGISSIKLRPTSERLANAHFVGQTVTLPGVTQEDRRFGLNVGTFCAKVSYLNLNSCLN